MAHWCYGTASSILLLKIYLAVLPLSLPSPGISALQNLNWLKWLNKVQLGPLLFTLYTTSLSSMIFEHAISHHLYADDSQLYVSFASGDSAAALNGLQSCLASVQLWMSTNKLTLNPYKTEFLLIGNERQRSKYLAMFPIELIGVKINPAKSARNLGVIFDKNFTFRSHISVVCNLCFYHMRDLRRIRPSPWSG